jgi:methionyl-tRNA formyltransferase
MPNKTFILISGSKVGELCAQAFIHEGLQLTGVVTLLGEPVKGKHNFVPFCAKYNALLYALNTVDEIPLTLCDQDPYIKPDYFLVCGFSKLLPKEVYSFPEKFSIGSHPSELPTGRGRHPIEWHIVLRARRSAYTMFILDDGVDTGPILEQIPYKISRKDTKETLEKRVNEAAIRCASLVAKRLLNNNDIAYHTSVAHSSLYRKRTEHDGFIDFRMSCRAIDALVRTGYANILYKDTTLHVEKCFAYGLPKVRQGHGYILDRATHTIGVECDDGTIYLRVDHIPQYLNTGTFIHPPTYYAYPTER